MPKKTKKHQKQAPLTHDVHHICFTAYHWKTGTAKSLREAFKRKIPIEWHRELHALLSDVPRPPYDMIAEAWRRYNADKDTIDNYNITRAIAWLYVNIPDQEFRQAMQVQLDYFATKRGDA